MSAPSSLRTVVRSACRRRFLVVAAEQLSLAVTLVLCGGILLLLLGTQILDWYWLVFLAAAGLVFVAVRVKARMLGSYRVAQLLDRRLNLSDSISTAWFLITHPAKHREQLGDLQIQRAEAIAAGIRPASAFPFTGRKAWALTGAVAAAGFGLFAVRYLVTSSLSLREALIPLHFEAVVERLRDILPAGGAGEKPVQSTAQARRDRAISAPRNAQQLLQTPGSAQPGTPDPNGRNQIQSQQQSARAQSGKLGDSMNGSKESASQDAAQARTAEQQNGSRSASEQNSSTKELDNAQSASNQQSSNGLLNRMRDALSGLMAKMRQNESAQKQGDNSRASNDKKAGEQLANSNDQSSQSQQSATNQQAREQQPSQGQGQTTEKAQSAPASNANQLADKKRSDSQSGIGRQDGDKTLKEAEEQKAMGKLADIIGKRSASVTGDMTVETGSGKQELQTRFTGRMGVHSDTGGDINRDDIPVEFQAYVRAYMEQIRKQQTKTQ